MRQRIEGWWPRFEPEPLELPLTQMGKNVDKSQAKDKSSILEMLGLRSLLGLQVEMSRRKLEIGGWSSEELWTGTTDPQIDSTEES